MMVHQVTTVTVPACRRLSRRSVQYSTVCAEIPALSPWPSSVSVSNNHHSVIKLLILYCSCLRSSFFLASHIGFIWLYLFLNYTGRIQDIFRFGCESSCRQQSSRQQLFSGLFPPELNRDKTLFSLNVQMHPWGREVACHVKKVCLCAWLNH